MERTTRKLGVYRLGLLSTLSVVALLAGPMARAFGEMPPEDCFAFCGGACACDPQGACGGQNCPGACACGAAGCMGGGCQNCVVQNCGCTFWGCPCGQHCSNGMPPCGGGPVVCEFGGCMATGCVNNVCPDICANADPGIPCDDCDCGNTNPPPVGCACGAAVCSNAAQCIDNCGDCGRLDCDCVASCLMPECGGMQTVCHEECPGAENGNDCRCAGDEKCGTGLTCEAPHVCNCDGGFLCPAGANNRCRISCEHTHYYYDVAGGWCRHLANPTQDNCQNCGQNCTGDDGNCGRPRCGWTNPVPGCCEQDADLCATPMGRINGCDVGGQDLCLCTVCSESPVDPGPCGGFPGGATVCTCRGAGNNCPCWGLYDRGLCRQRNPICPNGGNCPPG